MAKKRNAADGRDVDYREFEQKCPDPTDADRVAFAEVLSETLNRESISAMGADGMAALAQVARRYQGSKLILDPIAFELVDSVLRIRIDRQNRLKSRRREMSWEIAVSLYESPASRERLVNLWDALMGDSK